MASETLDRLLTVDDTPDIEALGRDLREAARRLSAQEARYLVDYYYRAQKDRIRAAHQSRVMGGDEPHALVTWLLGQSGRLEARVAAALDEYSAAQKVGRWARSIVGIGPVLAAGFLAHIDIAQAPTVGHIWRFAGLDPTDMWGKGEKRPWNARLKVICWKASESFVKTCNHAESFYGPLYIAQKAVYVARNDAGQYAERAAQILAAKRFGHDTEAYKAYSAGRLPDAHIHAMAERYTVKLFLAHWHHVAFEVEYGTLPPKPWVFTDRATALGLDHRHFIAPPKWPVQ